MTKITLLQSKAISQVLSHFLFLSLFSASISFCYAQELITAGPKAGLNLTTLVGKDAASASTVPRFMAGAFVSIKPHSQLALQLELNYTQKGARIRNNQMTTSNISLGYLEVPVLVRFCYARSTRAVPYLATGPSTNLLLSARNTIYKESSVAPQYKKLDLGWSFGGGIEAHIAKNWLIIDLRYTPGFLKIRNQPNPPAVRTTVFTLSTALGFELYDRYGNRRR